MLLYIILAICLITILYFVLKLRSHKRFILSRFEKNNCIVYGKKGSGKDLLFNYVINNRKKKCSSNIQYNPKYCNIREISSFELKGIDYNSLIDNTYDHAEKNIEEKQAYYISDAGIYLPCQYCSYLDRKYKSFPVFYALSRHLGQMNVHCNTQNLSRIWDKLREQADSYFCVKYTVNFFGFLISKIYYYDKYESAKNNLLPMDYSIFSSKETLSLVKQFNATNGDIRTLYIVQHKSKIKYDTRIFHDLIYGCKAPKKHKRR